MSRAVFVVPLSSGRASGPVAVWLLAAGWAAAAGRLLGSASIVTPQGVISAEEARALASRPALRASASGAPPAALTMLKTAAKDLRQILVARRFRQAVLGIDHGTAPAFVWQHHQIFHDAGFALARRVGCPLVLHVDAPIVWEAERWGVRRPGWGRTLERVGEVALMRDATLVTCPSQEVATEVEVRGVPAERVMVTPGGVDLDVFRKDVSAAAVRERHGLADRFVVGWTGSFRSFHGIETALEGFAAFQKQCENSALLLVGDGFERPRLQEYARKLGIRDAVFTGTVAHGEMPEYVAAMDVALVLAPRGQGFHYSPMKLREYMAVGRPVVAARIGEVERILTHEEDALLVRGNDADALATALLRLHAEPKLRDSIARTAHQRIAREGSWDRQVERVLEALGSHAKGPNLRTASRS